MIIAWMTLVVGVLTFVSFGVGIRFYFKKPSGKTLPMYLVTEVGIIICVIQLGLLGYWGVGRVALPEWRLGLALLLYLSSLSLFWWSLSAVRGAALSFAYSKDLPQRLIQVGPYRYVRHPFYTAYTFGFFAAPVALGSPWLALTGLFMFFVYRQSAVMEEQKFAASELKEDYQNYIARTGRFFPHWRQRGPSKGL